jgi:uncharacterized membrane protein
VNPDIVNLGLAALALALALALRPWRAVGPEGPPWPWVACWALLPFLWSADHYAQAAVAQPLSGACLLMLMCGWPMAVLALVPVAAATALMAGLDAAEALHRYVWLGLLPATLGVLLGAAIRRWLPRHLMVYILGRGFFGTAMAVSLAGGLSALTHQLPAGLMVDDLLVARWLAGWGDAWITGMFAAIFVAFRPQWLATYTDSLYLPVDRAPPDQS